MFKSYQLTFEKKFYSKGIITVGDLLSDAGVLLKGANVLNANLSPLERFKLMGIVDAIPRKLENSQVALLKVSSKLLYTAFKSRKQAPPTAQKKFLEKFPQLQTDWSKIYSLPFIVTIKTKIREFQYKILNNYSLYK